MDKEGIFALWTKIDQLSSEIEAKAIAWRRDIHQYPELGFQEFRTSEIVANHLKSLGIEVKTGVGKTGVVGVLGVKKNTPVVALRADMDALPVMEVVNVPFASKVKTTLEGKEVFVMHACGHDVHMAIALGVACLLSSSSFPGTIRFLFQPSEEAADEEGISGAPRIIADGAMDSAERAVAFRD